MNDDQRNIHGKGAPLRNAEVLAKCDECGQLYERTNAKQVRYHEHPGHKAAPASQSRH